MVEYCHVLRREGIGEPSAFGMGICGPSSPMYKRQKARRSAPSPLSSSAMRQQWVQCPTLGFIGQIGHRKREEHGVVELLSLHT
jgi:hypothetical protein